MVCVVIVVIGPNLVVFFMLYQEDHVWLIIAPSSSSARVGAPSMHGKDHIVSRKISDHIKTLMA